MALATFCAVCRGSEDLARDKLTSHDSRVQSQSHQKDQKKLFSNNHRLYFPNVQTIDPYPKSNLNPTQKKYILEV